MCFWPWFISSHALQMHFFSVSFSFCLSISVSHSIILRGILFFGAVHFVEYQIFFWVFWTKSIQTALLNMHRVHPYSVKVRIVFFLLAIFLLWRSLRRSNTLKEVTKTLITNNHNQYICTTNHSKWTFIWNAFSKMHTWILSQADWKIIDNTRILNEQLMNLENCGAKNSHERNKLNSDRKAKIVSIPKWKWMSCMASRLKVSSEVMEIWILLEERTICGFPLQKHEHNLIET